MGLLLFTHACRCTYKHTLYPSPCTHCHLLEDGAHSNFIIIVLTVLAIKLASKSQERYDSRSTESGKPSEFFSPVVSWYRTLVCLHTCNWCMYSCIHCIHHIHVWELQYYTSKLLKLTIVCTLFSPHLMFTIVLRKKKSNRTL